MVSEAGETVSRQLLVHQLSLCDFRNYHRLSFEVGVGLVVLAGANGVGKTNLLEAAAVAFLGSSPRTSAEARCVRDGAAAGSVHTNFEAGGRAHEHHVTIQLGRGKRLVRDDNPEPSIEAFAEPYPATVFLPERLLVVRGAPARRRAVLDRLVARMSPTARQAVRDYTSAVTQRNAVLRQGKSGRDVRDALAPWTEQVITQGEQLRELRHEALAAMAGPFRRRFEALTGFTDGRLSIELRGPDLASAMEENAALDQRRATTGAGPHLDDLHFFQGSRDLRTFGSTGEQRAALLAWSLAELDVTAALTGLTPLLLLDEPYAELDSSRRRRLTAALLELPQAIVTTTEPPAHLVAAQAAGADVFLHAVSSGAVEPWTSPPRN